VKGAAAGTRSGALFHRPLLLVSGLCAVAVAALTVLVYIDPVIPLDGAIARAVQSVPVGPLSPILDFYRQIGGPYAVAAEAVVFAIILVLNRASWRLLIAGALASGWYFLLVGVISRPRPRCRKFRLAFVVIRKSHGPNGYAGSYWCSARYARMKASWAQSRAESGSWVMRSATLYTRPP